MHSTGSGPSPKVIGGKKLHRDDEGKIVKVTWWRPHGQTAIAPGTLDYYANTTRAAKLIGRVEKNHPESSRGQSAESAVQLLA